MTEKDRIIEQYLEAVMTDIEFFAEEFLPHFISADIPKFHSKLYRLLRDEKRLVVAAPRGFAKSTLSSVIYPLWLAVTGFKKDVCVISASEGLAVEMLRRIKRELESNTKLIEYFGDLRTPKWSETHFITSTGVAFRARGAGGQIRGFRPDCLILDDIETDESVESEEQRKKLKDWLFKACLNTLLPHGQFIMVGTIIHFLGVLADLLETDQGWNKHKFQAYEGGEEKEGKELWPSMWPHHKLQERKREIGSFAFAAEYMNNPMSDEAAPIKPHQIRVWKELPEQLSMAIAVDPAYSEEEKSDFKVASLLGIDQNANRYLVNYIRTHAPTKEFYDSILNMWLQNRHRITAVGLPNSGTEKSFFQSFISYAQSRKLYPPIVEVKNTFISGTGAAVRNKKQRIIAYLQPLFEAGKYYIGSEHHEAREELLTIGSSRWDDLVDTMAYGEQLLNPTFDDIEVPTVGRYGEPIIEEKKTGINDYGY